MSDFKNEYDQIIAGHDYDGIQEFDNPLPMWWLWTFFGTIIFAFIYFIHYQFNVGPTLDQELAAEMATIDQLKATHSESTTNIDFAKLIGDPKAIKVGAAVFTGKCASCHGDKGQGIIGPNLTDKFWIHGSAPAALATTISKGVLDKGMPPWETILQEDELQSVIAFITSIKGTNPAGGKPPQGNEVPDYY